jgi:hypothetical protein
MMFKRALVDVPVVAHLLIDNLSVYQTVTWVKARAKKTRNRAETKTYLSDHSCVCVG